MIIIILNIYNIYMYMFVYMCTYMYIHTLVRTVYTHHTPRRRHVLMHARTSTQKFA